MKLTMHPKTRKYLAGAAGIWLLLGLEIGLFYAHVAWPTLVTIALLAALGEWLIMTVIFLQLDEERWGFSAVLFPLLLLAVLLVGTLQLLMRVFFEWGG